MRSDKMRAISGLTGRQKIIAIIIILILLVILWQVIDIFRSKSPGPTITPTTTANKAPALNGNKAANTVPANIRAPQVPPSGVQTGQLMNNQPSPQELEIMRLQQETQSKYLADLNQLQVLKVQRDIAETNKAIAEAELATVKAQKNVVSMLSPSTTPPDTYAKNLAGGQQAANVPAPVLQPVDVAYSLISVTQLQSKWSAVLGYQGNLYYVSVGFD